MYLSYKKDFENFRLTFTSNRMSSTFYVEQLPEYTENEKVRVFSLYFYFHGNDDLNVRKLLDIVSEFGGQYDYDGVKGFMLAYCGENNDGEDYAYSEKETSGFNVRPRDGFSEHVQGLDFTGVLAWDYFMFTSKDGRRIVSSDSDSARKLFKTQMSNRSFLGGKSYDNLINILKDGDYRFEVTENGRR